MKGRLGLLADVLAGNLWLIPLIAFTLAFIVSHGLIAFDGRFDVTFHAWFVYGGSPQGARQLLSTIAGSMITFIGLVFSSTILILQLASSQFSPRIMRSFFRDRIIQLALGTFIATFAYAIFVLRAIREDPLHPFVPGLSTYIAIILVWLSLAMFVTYINHIAQRIRAINVIKIAADETLQCIRDLYDCRPPEAIFVRPVYPGNIVSAQHPGVVADADPGALLRLAVKYDAKIEVIPLSGDYLCTGAPIALIWSHKKIETTFLSEVAEAISIEHERTMRDDVLFGIRQLVDIADKALSPGINDPTTAVQVLDQLHELLRAIAMDPPRSDSYADESGELRVLISRPDWQGYLDNSLEEILLYGRDSIQVLRRLRVIVMDLDNSVSTVCQLPLRQYLARIETCIDAAFSDVADQAAARRLPAATLARRQG